MTEQPFDPAQLFTPTRAASSSSLPPQDSPDVPPSAADGPPTSDDPIAIRSPSGSPLTETAEVALVEDICTPQGEGGPPFYVEVPELPEEQKTLYEPVFGDRFMVPDSAPEPDELTGIAGEHEVDGVLCYFARGPDGILHRVSTYSSQMPRALLPFQCIELSMVAWRRTRSMVATRFRVHYAISMLLSGFSMRVPSGTSPRNIPSVLCLRPRVLCLTTPYSSRRIFFVKRVQIS